MNTFLIWILISKVVSAQLNGEFWWLNEKLSKYSGGLPPSPKFEELSEFDTDESSKIIFRDNELFTKEQKTEDLKKGETGKGNEKLNIDFHLQDQNKIVWPDDTKEGKSVTSDPMHYTVSENVQVPLKEDGNKVSQQDAKDIFEFKFPDRDNFIWKDKKINTSIISTPKASVKNKTENTRPNKIISDKISFKPQKQEMPETESICTFLKKVECHRRGGVVYEKRERGSKKFSIDSQQICCILPISTTDESSKIQFVDNIYEMNKRNKRSKPEVNLSVALKQRYALLMRRYASQAHKTKPNPTAATKTTQKIVTQDDDYVDPYRNIKNSNFKKTSLQNRPNNPTTTKYYNGDDYIEDYVVELPKPGLVGLYSDHDGTTSTPRWSFVNEDKRISYGGENDYDDDEDSGPSFVYGASLDPRLEDRLVTSKPPRIGRPAKMTTHTIVTSDEISYDSESQTISYQSNPDFQVLNGFKLLNLVRDKNKILKNGKKTTTESVADNSEEVLVASAVDTDYEDVFDTNQQVDKDCGNTVIEGNYEKDKNVGEAENGSHPWLTLVVLTRRRQTILCYATLVHARAAITAADCVHGNSCPGEVTLIAGAWDLSDETHEEWQKRMATIHLHSEYRPGELANNLAFLHWKRPLKLNANVQPACLTDPHVGDDCRFYGWGGYDQAIRSHSRWQRASILTPKSCNERISKRETIPNDAFCASVHSRGTVTGVGAPLMCTIGGRHAAAGVAIWRDHVVVMAPAHQWAMQVMADLRLR